MLDADEFFRILQEFEKLLSIFDMVWVVLALWLENIRKGSRLHKVKRNDSRWFGVLKLFIYPNTAKLGDSIHLLLLLLKSVFKVQIRNLERSQHFFDDFLVLFNENDYCLAEISRNVLAVVSWQKVSLAFPWLEVDLRFPRRRLFFYTDLLRFVGISFTLLCLLSSETSFQSLILH